MVWAYVAYKYMYVSLKLCVFLCYVCTFVIPSNPSFENDVRMDSPLHVRPLHSNSHLLLFPSPPPRLCTGKGQR